MRQFVPPGEQWRMRMNRLVYQPLIIACIVVSAALAGAVNTGRAAEDPPIHIAADHMSSTEKTNSVLFTGAVDAKQGDLRILSDEMTVFYSPKGKTDTTNARQQVEKLICVGNVEITRGEWLGTSKRMTYLARKRQVILEDNAKAWQDQNMVAGDKIIYYLDEGRSEVVADTKAVIGGTEQKDDKPARVNMTIIQQ